MNNLNVHSTYHAMPCFAMPFNLTKEYKTICTKHEIKIDITNFRGEENI